MKKVLCVRPFSTVIRHHPGIDWTSPGIHEFPAFAGRPLLVGKITGADWSKETDEPTHRIIEIRHATISQEMWESADARFYSTLSTRVERSYEKVAPGWSQSVSTPCSERHRCILISQDGWVGNVLVLDPHPDPAPRLANVDQLVFIGKADSSLPAQEKW